MFPIVSLYSYLCFQQRHAVQISCTEIVVYPTLQKQNYQLFKNLKWHFSTLISSYIFLAIDSLNITAYFL